MNLKELDDAVDNIKMAIIQGDDWLVLTYANLLVGRLIGELRLKTVKMAQELHNMKASANFP